jgi:polar amino acid transport system substrate-binding protein
MRGRGRVGLTLLGLLLAAGAARAAEPSPADEVQICFSDTDSTPYVHRNARKDWEGAALDLVRAAFERAGLRPHFTGLPWARCVREVKGFDQRRVFEAMMPGSRSADREAEYLLSAPLHFEHGGVWYPKARFPDGPRLVSRADLAHYQLCGMHGSNFYWLERWGVKAIDTQALSVQAVLDKLEKGRCELFPASREIPLTSAEARRAFISPALAFEPYPDESEFSRHVLFTRSGERGAALRARFNEALIALHRSGEADRIYRRYLPFGTSVHAEDLAPAKLPR